MIGNYVILAVGIFTIFVTAFKIKNEISFRVLGITTGINAILISTAQIMRIQHILNYPIALLGVLTFIIITYKIWKIREIPEKKVAAYVWLIGMPCLAVFVLIMYLIIEAGVFE